jgi:hypothetical protein
MTKIRLPLTEGYQPSIKILSDNLQTKGYQPQKVTTTNTSSSQSPPKKP